MAKFVLPKWTLVQHSGYGYAEKPQFEAGVETRMLSSEAQKKRVLKRGGVLFSSYTDAEQAAMNEMYPTGYEGLIPNAQGTFLRSKFDYLRLYRPAHDYIGMEYEDASHSDNATS